MKADSKHRSLSLESGARVAVVGGGPAGSFFTYFFLVTAERLGLDAQVDIYDPRDFFHPGPAGCNMCGGIVSESLVQLLSTEGINLPNTVVQRGIDSYVLHMDIGSARIDPPGHEKRIAAVHRGAGPRGCVSSPWQGLDGYLQRIAVAKGARVVRARVERIEWQDGRPCIVTKSCSEPYDLLVGAVGVNGPGIKVLQAAVPEFQPPKTTKTFICELPLGAAAVNQYLGASMHVFLLNVPRLEFGAVIPKGEYATVVLLGRNIDRELVAAFLKSPAVRECLPPGWEAPADYCRCFPFINIAGSPKPFADRVVFIGDSGENRLYKDGIGGAYRTAKAAAKTAIFEGVSERNFRRHYFPVCHALSIDNRIGKLVFAVTGVIQHLQFARRGLLRMVRCEQAGGGRQRMSSVLWDTFTGSAPYRDIFLRTLRPRFLVGLGYNILAAHLPAWASPEDKEDEVRLGDLGKIYHPGEVIVRQGEPGDRMFVIQAGKVEVIRQEGEREVRLAELAEGDFFGEMALFDQDVRSATVRPVGEVRVLTIDRKMFLRQIHEDPSLAFRIMLNMSRRIRRLDAQLAEVKAAAVHA